jgi:PAS domain S-box-containing protein
VRDLVLHPIRHLLHWYVILGAGIALTFLRFSSWNLMGDSVDFARAAIWLFLLGILAEKGSTHLKLQTATSSVAFIPFLGAILLLSTGWAMAIAGATMLVAEVVFRRKPLIKVVHNVSKEMVAVGTASLVYQLLGGVPSMTRLVLDVHSIVAMIVVYFLLGQGATALAVALSTAERFDRVWRRLVGQSLFYDFASSPLAILLAFLYIRLGLVGLIVVVVPLVFVRHVYAMNVALETANRGLGEREEASRRVIEASPFAILVYANGSVQYANAAATQLIGARTADQLLGRHPVEFMAPELERIASRWLERIQEDRYQPQSREISFRRFDGDQVYAEVTGIPFTYRGAPATQLILRDVTASKRADEERRQLEAQMQQAQKLESLGVMAGGIAHDFNNLLVGVLGNASLALEVEAPDAPSRPMLVQIEKAAVRASELTNQMLAYAGRGRFVVEPTDINALVEEMTHLVEAGITKEATIAYDFADELPLIEMDATQIRQVVMNLITNAAEALDKEGGDIRVRTGIMQVGPETRRERVLPDELVDGQYVFLEVSDNGCGMDEETKAKIFDPFFTTKFTGRGLGLASVLGIVRSHLGTLTVSSAVGRGTTFTVLLPASSRKPVKGSGSETVAPGHVRGAVLVVDDEAAVRDVASQMLQRAGFEVIAAPDGREGVERFAERHADIAAVLLDMTMPRLNGEDAFAEMQRIAPKVPVILMSGFAEVEAMQRFAGKGLAGFLQKPFRAATLLQKLPAASYQLSAASGQPPANPSISDGTRELAQ